MKARRLLAASIVACAAFSSASRWAHADAAPESTLRDSLRGDAREKLDLGTALYNKASYAEARDAFYAAYTISGDARVLYNVAVCDKALGHYARALESVRASIKADQPLPASYQRRASEAIAALTKRVALVTVDAPEGAEIAIDGAVVQGSPVPLDVGPHTLTVTKKGFAPVNQAIDAIAGTQLQIPITLSPSPGRASIACANAVPCDIRIGDEDVGPAPASVSRAPGHYRVRALVRGSVVSEDSFDLRSGDEITVVLTPRAAATAHLRLTTENATDTITVDGHLTMKSGAELDVAAGEHRLLVSRDGVVIKSLDVVLHEGETRDIRWSLDDDHARRGTSVWWFVGGGVVLAGVATAIAVYASTRPTTFEGSAAGTLNPYVVTASARGGIR